MKHLLIAAATVLMMHSALAAEPDTEFRQQVNAFVDSWHDDAANTRPDYWDKFTPDAVFIGTDKSEVWRYRGSKPGPSASGTARRHGASPRKSAMSTSRRIRNTCGSMNS